MMKLVRRTIRYLCRNRDHDQKPAPHLNLYRRAVAHKAGLEIGGPSNTFRKRNVIPIYDKVGSLDNCDFSANTVWADHSPEFVFSSRRPPGRSFFCEGSALTPIADAGYDFVLSSHNLEHFANPMKALLEWKRVLRPGGALILILPYFRSTFDHRRNVTPVRHMQDDFEQNTGEDDLTHLPEILEKHDLERDLPAGTVEEFRQRSLDNFNNRCLHHHVFDETNIRELLTVAGFQVLAVDFVPLLHLCVLARQSAA